VGKGTDELEVLKILEEDTSNRKKYDWLDFPIVPPGDRVVIPKLVVSAPLVGVGTDALEGGEWSELEDSIQEELKNGLVHYPGTAEPGDVGNVFITGHSSNYPWIKSEFNDVFALLEQLEVGDEYYVYYKQKKYTYIIRNKFEVNPDNIDVLMQPHDKKMSTLMTCTPVGTALRRLILQAELVE